MSSRFTFDRELLIRIFFFGTFAFLLTQAFQLAKPFIPSVLLASVLAMMFYPAYQRVRRAVRKPGLAAFIMTVTVVLAGIIPLIFFIWLVIHESTNLIPVIQGVLAQINEGNLAIYQDNIPGFLYPTVERVTNFLSGINVDLKDLILENARELTAHISAVGTLIARNAIITFFKLLILILTLFFLFRDGEKILRWVMNLIPMESSHKQAVAKSAYETFWAVTIGVFLTAAAQGAVAMIGFLIAGVRMAVLLGLGVGAVSLLGASFIICIPVALFMMLESTAKGIFLLIWGAVLVGWLDNLLKPLLIGSRARMPFVLVFFSILGGIKYYGLVGLLLGPMLVACVLTFIRIYKETYGT
ncbi:MAG: putative transport protein YdiK [Elusimicrobia bacterium]|nr:putative transport protein YdiK [Elusimicrobiota bacterium]